MEADGDPLEQAAALVAADRAAEAARLLRGRLAAGRGGALARVALVQALIANGDTSDALEAAHEAVALNPDVPQVVLALGDALFAADSLPTAIAEYNRVTRLDPDGRLARLRLGQCWLAVGEPDLAQAQLDRADPEAPELAALLARIAQMRTQRRADAGYVRHLFDQFSSDYDSRMRQDLRYRAPEILRELADLVMPGRAGLAILDLGCGTGFAAEAFAGLSVAIDGIDLSPEMLVKARRRRLYRTLQQADFETGLARGGADYDLVLAADAFVYVGDLVATFAGVARRLKPDGFFLFTVERHDGDGFALGPKRRWRHAEGYLRELAENSGFDVAGLVACAPRFEQNEPVDGLAVALSRRV